jgi:hypothetical protein
METENKYKLFSKISKISIYLAFASVLSGVGSCILINNLTNKAPSSVKEYNLIESKIYGIKEAKKNLETLGRDYNCLGFDKEINNLTSKLDSLENEVSFKEFVNKKRKSDAGYTLSAMGMVSFTLLGLLAYEKKKKYKANEK